MAKVKEKFPDGSRQAEVVIINMLGKLKESCLILGQRRLGIIVFLLLLLGLILPFPAQSQEVSFIWPVKGEIITRFDGSKHRGIDIKASVGEKVIAAAQGSVHWVGKTPRGEPYISIDHPNDLTTTYISVDASVHKGQWVNQGDPIGIISSVGEISSPIPHLHLGMFWTRTRGDPVYEDPEKWLPHLLPMESVSTEKVSPPAGATTLQSQPASSSPHFESSTKPVSESNPNPEPSPNPELNTNPKLNPSLKPNPSPALESIPDSIPETKSGEKPRPEIASNTCTIPVSHSSTLMSQEDCQKASQNAQSASLAPLPTSMSSPAQPRKEIEMGQKGKLRAKEQRRSWIETSIAMLSSMIIFSFCAIKYLLQSSRKLRHLEISPNIDTI
ncbi:MAG: M23 family metallopeptidase [Actinomycetota bacterium]|nr:M23 family metallopeptidase [Actinomycetota bacterium]MDI6821475.1 M23 family metallopeptidase [Actinomycetota bacterium]